MGFKTLNEVDVADGTVQLIACKSIEGYSMAGGIITFESPFSGSYLIYSSVFLQNFLQIPKSHLIISSGSKVPTTGEFGRGLGATAF